MNVQYAIKDGDIYVLEVNPRASRTVPFVAKVIGMPVAKIAARSWPARRWPSFNLEPGAQARAHVGVKEAVFPFARFPGVDTVLGPEMRSTGEVMGIDRDFAVAFAKSQLGGGAKAAQERHGVRLGARRRQAAHLDAVRLLLALGFKVMATSRHRSASWPAGRAAEKVNKVLEGRPHIVDAIKNGASSWCSTPPRGRRRWPTAARCGALPSCIKCPYYTTLSGAVAAAQGIKAYLGGRPRSPCAAELFFRGDLWAGLCPAIDRRGLRPSPTAGPPARGCYPCFGVCAWPAELVPHDGKDGEIDGKGSDDRGGYAALEVELKRASRWSVRASSSRSPRRARMATFRRTPNITPPRKRSRTTRAASPNSRTSWRAPRSSTCPSCPATPSSSARP
jgi:hypothetical protein